MAGAYVSLNREARRLGLSVLVLASHNAAARGAPAECPNVGTETLCGEFAVLLAAKKGDRRAIRVAHARSHGTHTAAQWEALCCEMSWCCARCGNAIDGNPDKDHIVPLYLGGSDAITNLQPLCPRCNRSKRADTTNHVSAHREAQP